MNIKKMTDKELIAFYNKNKTTNATLKLVLNSTYGLLGSKYSKLYSPKTLLHVTLSGQLTMLCLIERLGKIEGVVVKASNTDSVVYIAKKGKAEKKAYKVLRQLEKESGLVFEDEHPDRMYMRDINSYVQITGDYISPKGFYGETELSKSPQYPIVQEAIREFILNGTSMKKTIKKCKDPAQFCISRAVTGGALWSAKKYPDTDEYEEFIIKFKAGERKDNKALRKRNDMYQRDFVMVEGMKNYIGKTVRYYFSKKGHPIFTAKLGSKVFMSNEFNGVVPMMELPKKLPKDLDYDAYVSLANRHLVELGWK